MSISAKIHVCAICARTVPTAYFEDHHLTPRCKKGKDKIEVCCDCGNQIHELFTIQELKYLYNTLEALLSSDKIQKWIRWIRKKPNEFGVCMKKFKKH